MNQDRRQTPCPPLASAGLVVASTDLSSETAVSSAARSTSRVSFACVRVAESIIQPIEQMAFNHRVRGSSPGRITAFQRVRERWFLNPMG
jgi:hypothetical protein